MFAIIPITPQVSNRQTAFSYRTLIRAPDNGGKPSKLTDFSALYLEVDFQKRTVHRHLPIADSLENRVLFILFLVTDFKC